jgi:hypothetical protein
MQEHISEQDMKIGRGKRKLNSIPQSGASGADGEIFAEQYRVVAVESQSLTVQGVRSGKVLTIVNHTPEIPLTPEEYPLGKLIALSDPSTSQPN